MITRKLPTSASCPRKVARELFRHEDPIGKSIHILDDFFRVVGVVAPRAELDSVEDTSRRQDFSDNIYIPLETYWSRFGESYSVGNNGGTSAFADHAAIKGPS